MTETRSTDSITDSRASFSTWLGVVCLFVLFGLIVLAVIGPSPRTTDYEEARAKKRMERLKALHEETQKDLTTYAWVDKSKGVARIPIARAMELTVADLAQKSPAPAGPIATPATQAPSGGSPAPAGPQQSAAPQPPQSAAPSASPAGQTTAPPAPAAQPSPAASAAAAPATTP